MKYKVKNRRLVKIEPENPLLNRTVIVGVDGREKKGVVKYVGPEITVNDPAEIRYNSNDYEGVFSPRKVHLIVVEIDGWARPFFDTDIMNFVGDNGELLKE